MSKEMTNVPAHGSNIDPRLQHFVLLARGLHDVGAGRVLTDKGRGKVTAGLVMAAQSIHGNTDEYNKLVTAAANIHADQREQREKYADAHAYFRDVVTMTKADADELKRVKSEDLSLNRYMAPEKKAEDKMGTIGRQIANAPVNARNNALMFACSVLVMFHKSGVDWKHVHLSRSGESIITDTANLRLLFADLKKNTTIDRMEGETGSGTIGTYGDLRFSALAEEGNKWLRIQGIKKAPPRRTADTTALRDGLALVARETEGGILNADAKSYDAKPDESVALKAFISIAHALNDGTLKGIRFNERAIRIIDTITEGATAEVNGTDVPPLYKALMNWASEHVTNGHANIVMKRPKAA